MHDNAHTIRKYGFLSKLLTFTDPKVMYYCKISLKCYLTECSFSIYNFILLHQGLHFEKDQSEEDMDKTRQKYCKFQHLF